MTLKEEIEKFFKNNQPDAGGASKLIYYYNTLVYSIDNYDKNKYNNYKGIKTFESEYILKPIELELTKDKKFIYAKWKKLEKVDHNWVKRQNESSIKENFIGLENAVKQLHDKNLVWLDIKPNNMMRDINTIKLIDLDGAIDVTPKNNVTPKYSVTPKYILCSIKCSEDGKIQDKYALYISFIELLTGKNIKTCAKLKDIKNFPKAPEQFKSIYDLYVDKIKGLFKVCNPQKSSQRDKNLYKIKF